MTQEIICAAIRSKSIVRFHYSGDKAPGTRVVEPHMIAYNAENLLVLSGWFLGGVSESREGGGWREYLLSSISSLAVLPENFAGPRPRYNPNGGKIFHNVQCRL